MGEINRMQAAQNIIDGYRAMRASKNWARWGEQHPDLARLVNGLHAEAKARYG